MAYCLAQSKPSKMVTDGWSALISEIVTFGWEYSCGYSCLPNTSHRCELLVAPELFMNHTMESVLKRRMTVLIIFQDKVPDYW